MAELLIRAVDSWGELESRSRKGDIIVVRPDGWRWGKEECLPTFVVCKTTETVEEAKKYEQPLFDKTDPEKPVMLKRRQYCITAKEVDDRSLECKDFTEITAVSLQSAVVDKTKVA